MSEILALRHLICFQDTLIADRESDLAVAWKNEAYRVYVEKEKLARTVELLSNQMNEQRRTLNEQMTKQMEEVKNSFESTVKLKVARIETQIRTIERNLFSKKDAAKVSTRTISTNTVAHQTRSTDTVEKRMPQKNDIGDMIVELKTLEKEAKRLLIKT